MSNSPTIVANLLDHHPSDEVVVEEVIEGLQQSQKMIPSKYLYDDRGAELFEEITDLDEYYLTRTEVQILETRAAEISELLGPHCLLVEYGSGSGRKTRLLLGHLQEPVAYVPVDISKEQLLETANDIADVYPDITVIPICADYTRSVPLPDIDRNTRRNVVFFPGSTIGNFTPELARDFLSNIAALTRPRGALLIGIDLKKDRTIIESAYNDRRGSTAAFNLNILERLNRAIGSDFDLSAFRHHAFYNEAEGRIEMHLISECRQTVHVGDTAIQLEEGESICTEYSYKYSLEEFETLAESAGFSLEQVWTDERQYFSVQYLVPATG